MSTRRATVLILILIILSALYSSCAMMSASVCTVHRDLNKDLYCDVCGAAIPVSCTSHTDENHDGKCDGVGCSATLSVEHTDQNHDGICDALSCEETLSVTHTDENGDGFCDTCEATLTPPPTEEPPSEECESCIDLDKNFLCDTCGGKIVKEKLSLISGSVANFKIVLSSENAAKGEVIAVVDTLVRDLRRLGVSVEDWESETDVTPTDCEILIGSLCARDERYATNSHSYGMKGYCILVIDGKVVINAGSDRALLSAIELFSTEILGITESSKRITNLSVTDYDNIEYVQDDYRIKSFTLLDRDIRDFVIVAEEGIALDAAETLRDYLYEKMGCYLEIRSEYTGECAIVVRHAEKTGGEGYYATFSGSRAEFVCEYETVLKGELLKFFSLKFTQATTDSVSVSASDSYVKNVRDVYYEDFGAKGDGVTDDLEAIIAAHEYANAGAHVVHATPGATYYIGDNNGKNHYRGAVIMTDTVWTGANFIIDDSAVGKDEESGGTYARSVAIFTLQPTRSSFTVKKSSISVDSLSLTSTNIGYAPGFKAMVQIKNESQRNYIRYGANANSGAIEHEIILVDENGNIDPSTPLMWNYEAISSYVIYGIDDEPITVTGGSFTTVYNQEENVYDSYSRAVLVRRSNATVKDIKHENVGEGDTGCPSGGFTIFRCCYNVLFENIQYDNMKSFYEEKNGQSVLMGSYEIAGQLAIKVTWKDCTQLDFWRDEEKRYAAGGGIMGTNYCRDLTFDGCTLSSFDAHAGVWNVTIKNSEIEHINCIGGGTARIENTKIHVMYQKNAIMLRGDYGSLWMGDFYFIDCTLIAENLSEVALFDASWYNHDFGYDFGACMPTRVFVENITVDSESGLRVVKLVEEYVGNSANAPNTVIWTTSVWESTINGEENLNPYRIPLEWIITDTNGYDYLAPPAFTTEISVTSR